MIGDVADRMYAGDWADGRGSGPWLAWRCGGALDRLEQPCPESLDAWVLGVVAAALLQYAVDRQNYLVVDAKCCCCLLAVLARLLLTSGLISEFWLACAPATRDVCHRFSGVCGCRFVVCFVYRIVFFCLWMFSVFVVCRVFLGGNFKILDVVRN